MTAHEDVCRITRHDAPEPPGQVQPACSAAEMDFLRLLSGGLFCLRGGRASAGIKSLIDRGYCRTFPERIGPLGIYTGEICIRLTEAGRRCLPNAAALPSA